MKLEYDKILAEIVYQVATDKAFASYFLAMAPPPSSWPKCTATELAKEFYEMSSARSLTAAMVKVSEAAELLPRIELSQSYDIALSQAVKAINYGLGLEILKEIQKDPSEVFTVIRKASSVNELDSSFDLLSAFDEITTSIAEKISTNKNLLKIKDFSFLSNILGGFNEGRVGLVVAGSGVGKTTLVLNILLSALKDYPALFINMEMNTEDITKRLVCIINGLSVPQLESNMETFELGMSKFYSYLAENNKLFITDGRSLSRQQIISSIYKRAAEGVKIIVVDYDQKIKGDLKDQEWMVILQSIEALEEAAKATGTHIIVLAQGDEDNKPKASKRSVQPCAYVLALYEEMGNYYLKSIKNRFGRKFILGMDVDLSAYRIREGREVNETNILRRL